MPSDFLVVKTGDMKDPDSHIVGIKTSFRPRFKSSSAMPGRVTDGKTVTVGKFSGGSPMKSKVTPNSIIARRGKSDVIAPQACRQCLTFPAFPDVMGGGGIVLTKVSCVPGFCPLYDENSTIPEQSIVVNSLPREKYFWRLAP